MAGSFEVKDLPDDAYEKQANFLYDRPRDIDCSFNDLKLIKKYSLVNDMKTEKKFVKLEDVHPSYLILPKKDEEFRFDLKDSFDESIFWSKAHLDKFDKFLDFIQQTGTNAFDNDFVALRDLLTDMMCSPFLNRDRWSCGASKLNGTIFLTRYEDPTGSNYENANLMSFGGYRFENYITTNDPESRESIPFTHVKNHYSAVFKCRLRIPEGSDFELMYSSEMDCLDTGKTDDADFKNFVEIKTNRVIENLNQQQQFDRFKLVKWWAQSFLVGTPKIICGFKDCNQIVSKIQQFSVNSLPLLKRWSKQEALNYLYLLLQHVRFVMKNETDPNIVYVFSKNDGPNIECHRIVSDSRFRVLSESFIQQNIRN